MTLRANIPTVTASSELLPLPGMGFVNRVLGGGLPVGKLVGLVGPSGGGKTLLAMQIAHAVLLQGKRVLYIGCEPNNGIRIRFRTLVMGGDPGLPTWLGAQRRLEQRSLARRFAYVNSETAMKMSASGIRSHVSSFEDPVDLVVVDQLGMMKGQGGDLSWSSIRKVCAVLRATAAESGASILLLHQMRSAAKGQNAIIKPVVTDVMQSQSFVQKDVDSALFIGTKSDDGLCWLSNPKQQRHELVWLDGVNARFRGVGRVDDLYEIDLDAGRFVLTAEAELAGLKTPFDVAGHLLAGLCSGQALPDAPFVLPDVEVVS